MYHSRAIAEYYIYYCGAYSRTPSLHRALDLIDSLVSANTPCTLVRIGAAHEGPGSLHGVVMRYTQHRWV